jgi:hypothetical protein
MSHEHDEQREPGDGHQPDDHGHEPAAHDHGREAGADDEATGAEGDEAPADRDEDSLADLDDHSQDPLDSHPDAAIAGSLQSALKSLRDDAEQLQRVPLEDGRVEAAERLADAAATLDEQIGAAARADEG